MSELCMLFAMAAANPKAEAKAQQEEASTAFKLGRFEEAQKGYERAYEIFPAAGLLYNIGQCHRQLGHHERAAFFFQGYLREKPDSPMRDQVERLISEERALAIPATAPVAQPPRVIYVQASTEPSSMAVSAPTDAPAPKWWVWLIVAGGVAAVAGTVTAVALTSDALPAGSLGTLDRRD